MSFRALSNDCFAVRDGDGFRLALDNGAPIDDDGWGLIAPFGEHPKTRLFRDSDGQVKQQQFIQVLDNDAADALTSGPDSLFGKLKRAIIGVPVFKGHGDLNDADPAAVSNESQKIKIGVVSNIRKSARGIEARFTLDNDGEKAVTREGCKYPSAFWWVLQNGKRGAAILAKPFKLISVALTPYPNIEGVDALANAISSYAPARTALDNEARATMLAYQEAFAAALPLANQDPIRAHRIVITKHPALAVRLRPKKS